MKGNRWLTIFAAELTGSLTKVGWSLELACCSVHHVSQGNGPVPLQVGIRITSKSTNVVLQNSSTPESESERKSYVVNTHQGARCFGSNGNDWKHKPVRQFDCRNEYRTLWLIPGTRLADWVEFPKWNNKWSFWMNGISGPVLLNPLYHCCRIGDISNI